MDSQMVENVLRKIFRIEGIKIIRNRPYFCEIFCNELNDIEYRDEILVFKYSMESSAFELMLEDSITSSIAQAVVVQLQDECHMVETDAIFITKCMLSALGDDPSLVDGGDGNSESTDELEDFESFNEFDENDDLLFPKIFSPAFSPSLPDNSGSDSDFKEEKSLVPCTDPIPGSDIIVSYSETEQPTGIKSFLGGLLSVGKALGTIAAGVAAVAVTSAMDQANRNYEIEKAVKSFIESYYIIKGANEFSEISLYKLQKNLCIDSGERVLLAHDDTIMKSGKAGFVLTNKGIYCRKSFETRVDFTDWAEFLRSTLKFTDTEVFVSSGKRISYLVVGDSWIMQGFWQGLQEHLSTRMQEYNDRIQS